LPPLGKEEEPWLGVFFETTAGAASAAFISTGTLLNTLFIVIAPGESSATVDASEDSVGSEVFFFCWAVRRGGEVVVSGLLLEGVSRSITFFGAVKPSIAAAAVALLVDVFGASVSSTELPRSMLLLEAVVLTGSTELLEVVAIELPIASELLEVVAIELPIASELLEVVAIELLGATEISIAAELLGASELIRAIELLEGIELLGASELIRAIELLEGIELPIVSELLRATNLLGSNEETDRSELYITLWASSCLLYCSILSLT
jgi:hypothetical protein